MGIIEIAGLGKRGKWAFKITGGFSSFTAYMTEEETFFSNFPARLSGEKLAGYG